MQVSVEAAIKSRAMAHAVGCMRMYMDFARAAEGDPWRFTVERQCYRDVLESMKRCGLLDGYDLEHFTLQIGGVEVDV